MIKKATILLSLTTLLGCGEKSLEYLDLEADNRIPGVAFDSPPSGQTATDASFTILTTFSNVQILDTWNVYYVSDVTPQQKWSDRGQFTGDKSDHPMGHHSVARRGILLLCRTQRQRLHNHGDFPGQYFDHPRSSRY
jgi:hypothetical protein